LFKRERHYIQSLSRYKIGLHAPECYTHPYLVAELYELDNDNRNTVPSNMIGFPTIFDELEFRIKGITRNFEGNQTVV